MQAQSTQPKVQSVRVTRAFYLNGKPTKVNETIELPRILALEMKAANKVEFIEAKQEPAVEAKKPDAPRESRRMI